LKTLQRINLYKKLNLLVGGNYPAKNGEVSRGSGQKWTAGSADRQQFEQIGLHVEPVNGQGLLFLMLKHLT
jgi:hypothetical protein